MSLVASRFLMFTHLCVWCCHIYVSQPACPPNEPYAAALIALLTACYSLFPKKLQFCQVISPAEINRLLTTDLICCLLCEFPTAVGCVMSESFIFGGAVSTVREDSRRAKLSFLQIFCVNIVTLNLVKLPICTTWLHWWRSCWMKHTIRSLHHHTVRLKLHGIFFWEDEKWKIGKLNLIFSRSIFFPLSWTHSWHFGSSYFVLDETDNQKIENWQVSVSITTLGGGELWAPGWVEVKWRLRKWVPPFFPRPPSWQVLQKSTQHYSNANVSYIR